MPLYVYLGAAAVVASVPLLWIAAGGARVPVAAVKARLESGGEVHDGLSDLRDVELTRSAHERLITPAVSAIADRARRITPVGLIEALEERIQLAGMTNQWPIERVLAAKLILGTAGMLLGLLRFASDPSFGGVVALIVFAAVGYFIPDFILHRRAQERQAAIERALADTLDQMTVTVEAGLGFEQAMAHAGRTGKGPLSEELVRTLQDIQIGVPRTEALDNLLQRTDVADLRHFVVAVKQADQYGVPIAQVLRIQSREMRMKRRQRAEERAMKIPVKIVFPVVLFILPALLIVVGGPAVIRVWNSLISG